MEDPSRPHLCRQQRTLGKSLRQKVEGFASILTWLLTCFW
ncbi:unnamed protein product [Prunus armeniaca]|uniref:Uncharacterized protein n=1 Tax=Prunus armeniaca TaxID=36596 RepID=A0A6J5U5Q8_PRUAR|nr:unnamed protein product [Prunus armeniaca]CAB4301093.1 unnamed protein product [Prunus armeniaca]